MLRADTRILLAIVGMAASLPAFAADCPAGTSRTCAPGQTRDVSGCCPVPTAPKPAAPRTSSSTSSSSTSSSSRPRGSVPMATIPAGHFVMGSAPSEANHQDDETAHEVSVSSFQLMTREVTQGEFEAVMGFNPAAVGTTHYGGADHDACAAFQGVSLVDPQYPVMCVAWTDALEFANALSRKDGLTPAYTISGDSVTWNGGATGYRLPTEAEWEYAARAGTTTMYATASSNELALCGSANVADAATKAKFPNLTTASCNDGVAGLAKVGSYSANAWGLHDMIGNVWEWTWDWYGPYPDDGDSNPRGPTGGSYRVNRGGSWRGDPSRARVAYRGNDDPGSRSCSLGFRLARSIP